MGWGEPGQGGDPASPLENLEWPGAAEAEVWLQLQQICNSDFPLSSHPRITFPALSPFSIPNIIPKFPQ